jgi:hypothetical protein
MGGLFRKRYARIALVLILGLSFANLAAGVTMAAGETETGTGSCVGAEDLVKTLCENFVPEGAEINISDANDLIYYILLPFGMVAILVYIGIGASHIGKSREAAVLSILIALSMIPFGGYRLIWLMLGQFWGGAWAIQGGVGGTVPSLGPMIWSVMSKVMFFIIGFVLMDVGFSSGKIVGMMIGFIGVAVVFFAISTTSILPGEIKSTAGLIGGGGLFGAFIMIILFVGIIMMAEKFSPHVHA